MENIRLYNGPCQDILKDLVGQVDALVTDPPYGISMFGQHWDKSIPSVDSWQIIKTKLKPGAFGLVFSSIKLLHRMTINLEDAGFIIKDVLMWGQLNGMPKSRNVGLDIDKELGVESRVTGYYQYEQGYKNGKADTYTHAEQKARMEPASESGLEFNGFGLGIKPSYEPIIMIQNPMEKNLSVAQNMLKYGVGAINLEETRIPYAENEKPVGHNPHPDGRVMSNIIRVEEFGDLYDKFFVVPKVRQDKADYNIHPTVKPTNLMTQLVKLVTKKGGVVLDPYMGSGSTGVASVLLDRHFVGIELDTQFFGIAQRRIQEKSQAPTFL